MFTVHSRNRILAALLLRGSSKVQQYGVSRVRIPLKLFYQFLRCLQGHCNHPDSKIQMCLVHHDAPGRRKGYWQAIPL